MGIKYQGNLIKTGGNMASYNYNKQAVENLNIEDTAILDRLIDSESAREAHLKKDRSKRDKVMSITEAIEEFIHDGDIFAECGFGYVRAPVQANWALMRSNKKNLQAIGAPTNNHSYLSFAGNCAYGHTAYVGAEMRGFDRQYSRAIKTGRLKILSDWSHGSVGLGFKAAQLGVPGIYTKEMLGSGMLNYNPYCREMQNPMREDPDPVVFIPALYPDVALLHVHQADKYGNCRIEKGPYVNDISLAAACRKLIITCEEIVTESSLRENSEGVVIPFMNVDAVVEMPFGAMPGQMPGRYYWARQWWEKLLVAAKTDEGCEAFFKEWVMDLQNQYQFIDKLGGAKWIAEARRLTLAAEGEIDIDFVDFNYPSWTPEHDGTFWT